VSADGLITALVTLLVALIPYLVHLFREWRRKDDQMYKFVYIKVYHLTPMVDGQPPVYEKYISRLSKTIGVYDEFHYFRLNVFRKPQKNLRYLDRSSGIVDMQIIHPWQSLYFEDKGAAKVENVLEQIIKEPSNVFFTRTMYFNGIQKGNEDVGMRMENDTLEARLLVDFSSIPGFETFQKATPKGAYRSNGREEPVGVIETQPGIYLLSQKNLKKGDVLRMDFNLDWDVIKNQNG